MSGLLIVKNVGRNPASFMLKLTFDQFIKGKIQHFYLSYRLLLTEREVLLFQLSSRIISTCRVN